MRVISVHLVTSSSFAQGNTLADPAPLNATVIASGTLSGSFVSVPIDVLHLSRWSATVETCGVTGKGTWQVNNDVGTNPYNPAQLLHWVDYPGLEQQFTVNGLNPDAVTWNLQEQAYHWLRFKWTHTSGSGSIDVALTAKGSG